jgi:hypothetical protein
MAQFIESERGNILLVLDNFKFFKVNRPLASGLWVNKMAKYNQNLQSFCENLW